MSIEAFFDSLLKEKKKQPPPKTETLSLAPKESDPFGVNASRQAVETGIANIEREDENIQAFLNDVVSDIKRPGMAKQLAGTTVQAGYSAAAAVAGSQLATAIRNPTAWIAQGSVAEFDDRLKLLQELYQKDSNTPNNVYTEGNMTTIGAGPDYRQLGTDDAISRMLYESTISDVRKKEFDASGGAVDQNLDPVEIFKNGQWAEMSRKSKADFMKAWKRQQEIASTIESATPEFAAKAAQYAELADHNWFSQMFLDFAQNSPNLAAAGAGALVNKVAPGVGTALSMGFMAAQEERGFMQTAQTLGIPNEYAMSYARNYAMISAAIEQSQQVMNVGAIFGKGGKKVASKLQKSVLSKVGDVISDIGLEGFEEVAQGGAQHLITGMMVRDWIKDGHNIGKVNREQALKSGLALNEDGTINWTNKDSLKSFVRMAQSGGGVAAVSHLFGLAGKGIKGTAKATVDADLFSKLREIRETRMSQKQEEVDATVELWASNNPDAAAELASIENPKRRQWPKELPRVNGNERSRIAAKLKEIQQKEPPAGKKRQKPAELPKQIETPEGVPRTVESLQAQAEALPDGDPRIDEIAAQIEDLELNKAPETDIEDLERNKAPETVVEDEPVQEPKRLPKPEDFEKDRYLGSEGAVARVSELVEQEGLSEDQAKRIVAKSVPERSRDTVSGWEDVREEGRKEGHKAYIEQGLAVANNSDTEVTLIAMDVENQGGVNLAVGTTTGFGRADSLIRPMLDTIRKAVETVAGKDATARWARVGSDEYHAVVEGLSEEQARKAIAEAQLEIQKYTEGTTLKDGTKLSGIADGKNRLTVRGTGVSIGVVGMKGKVNATADQLIDQADNDLLINKYQGAQDEPGSKIEETGAISPEKQPQSPVGGSEEAGDAKNGPVTKEATIKSNRRDSINRFIKRSVGAAATPRQAVIKTLEGAKISRKDNSWNVIYKGTVIGRGKTNLAAWEDVASQLADNSNKFTPERLKVKPSVEETLEHISENKDNVWIDNADDPDDSFDPSESNDDVEIGEANPLVDTDSNISLSLSDKDNTKFALRQLSEAFPGAVFAKTESGWKGKLANGEEVSIEVNSNIPVDIETVMRTYDLTRAEAEERAAAGATIPKGISITLSDGTVITPVDVMLMIDPRRANDTTVKHEALHVARKLGLFDTERGNELWSALLDEYGSEEGIAKARETWTKPNGLWEKIRAFFMRLMSKLGRGVNAETALSETFSEKFWSQMEGSEDRRGIAYQIEKARTISVTSLKNSIVDEVRALRRAGEIYRGDAEAWQEWLDDASDRLSADPQAGYALVHELAHAKRERPLSARESALLLMHHRRVYSEYEHLSDIQFEKHDNGDIAAAASYQTRVLGLLQQLDQIEEVARRVGTEAGRSLNVRKIALARDFTIKGLIRKARSAQGGEKLSDTQLEEITVLAKKYRDLEKRYEKLQVKNKGLKKDVDALHKELLGASQRARLNAPGEHKRIARAKRKEILVDLKSALAGAGLDVSGFQETISKQTAPGISLQLQEKGSSPKSEETVNTPALRAVASRMAEFYLETGAESFGEFWAQAKLHIGPEANKVESVFKSAWREIEAGPDFVGSDFSDSTPRAITRAARAIYERQLDAGMRDRDQIVDIVQDAMKEVLPTRESTIEALSGYGQVSTPDDDRQMIRDHMAQLLQMTKLNVLEQAKAKAEELAAEGKTEDEIVKILDEENLLLKATGFLRDDPSDVVRRLVAQVNQMKREMPVSAAARKGQLQSAREAAKRNIRNRIADIKWELQNKRKRVVKNETGLRADNELIALRAERDKLMKIHREMFPPAGATEAQKDAAAEAGLDRAIALIEKQLATGDVEQRGPKKQRSNPSIDAKRARLESLRAQRKVLQDKSGVTERRILKQREANLRRRIADQQAILANEDFAPKVKPEPYAPSKEELRLKKKLEDVKKEVWQKMVEYHLANLSPIGKVGDVLAETAYLSRALMTSIDLSALGRQGFLAAAGHPLLAKQAASRMLKAFVSTQSEFETLDAIRNDPLWIFSEQVGLAVTDQDGSVNSQDEAFRGRLIRKTKGPTGVVLAPVVASGRAYTTFLNYMRFYLFKQMVENLGRSGRVTRAEGSMIASYVNACTGRSDWKTWNDKATALNMVFFAARWVSSRFQYMTIPVSPKFWKSSGRVRKAVAKEYARTLAGWTVFTSTLLAFGYLLSDDDEDIPTMEIDSRSSDFGKVKFGDTRIDTTAGLSSAVCITSRILPDFLGGGRIKRPDGTTKKFGGGYKPTTRLSVVMKYLRYKMAPIPGAIITTLDDRQNAVGQRETPLQTWGGLFLPLSFREVSDAMSNQGLTRGTMLATLAVLGFSASTYGPTTEYLSANDAEREDIFKGDLKKIKWDDPPIAYRKYLTPEQRQKTHMARQKNAGMRVWQATHKRPRFKDERDRWEASRQKALDYLVGFPKGDMRDAFDLYWRLSGRKKNESYRAHLMELNSL